MHAPPPSISTYWCPYVLVASATEIGRRSALRYSPHVGIVGSVWAWQRQSVKAEEEVGHMSLPLPV
jgi:hypothetical protein